MTDNDLNKTWGVFGILCSVVVYLWFRGRIRLVLSRAENSPSQGDPKDRIVMYDIKKMQMPPGDKSLRVTVFASKLEAWLRFAGLPYRIDRSATLKGAPKGQVPYITHGNTVVADTTFIIKYLTATYAKDLAHSHLQLPDPEQHALATACMAVIEEKLVYDLAYHRFVAESGWRQVQYMSGKFPWWIRPWTMRVMRAALHNRIYLQGTARHSQHDVDVLVRTHLECVSTILGNKPFLLGENPSEADASLFGVLDQFVYGRMVSKDMTDMIKHFPNLCQFTERIRVRYFPETLEDTPDAVRQDSDNSNGNTKSG